MKNQRHGERCVKAAQAVKGPREDSFHCLSCFSLPPPQPAPPPRSVRGPCRERQGRSYAHRCQQVFPWWPDLGLAPLCPCLSVLPTWGGGRYPSGVGWGPLTCLGPAKTPPWRPRVCLPKAAVIPIWDPWMGRVGLRRPGRARGLRSWGHQRRRWSMSLQAWGPGLLLSFLFVTRAGWLSASSLPLGHSEVKGFVVRWGRPGWEARRLSCGLSSAGSPGTSFALSRPQAAGPTHWRPFRALSPVTPGAQAIPGQRGAQQAVSVCPLHPEDPRGSSWRSVDRDFKGKINKAWTCLLLTSSRPVSMAAAPTVPPTLWDLGASSQPPSPSQAAFLPGFCWGSCSKMGSGRIR